MKHELSLKRLRHLTCRDCGVAQGKLHADDCWREECAKCGGQRMFCGCSDRQIMTLPRVPFVLWPNLCGICGARNPEMFHVPDGVWRHYVAPRERDKMICEPCWHWLTVTTDSKQYAAKYGDAVALGSAEDKRRARKRWGLLDEEPHPGEPSLRCP